MKRLFILYVFCSALLPGQGQPPVRLIDYRVNASLDERQSEVTGTVEVWLRIMREGTGTIQFRVPPNLDIQSVRDIDDDRFFHERIPDKNNFFVHVISLPAERNADDSVFLKIEFEAIFDTSSHAPQFINRREFLLRYDDIETWLPQFESHTSDRTSLILTTTNAFHLVGTVHDAVLTRNDETTTWSLVRTSPISLYDIFLIGGSSSIVEIKKTSVDSLTVLSLFIDTTRFHRQFSDSLLAYLCDAAGYFKELTGMGPARFEQTYACVGEPMIGGTLLRADGAVIDRNSPAYTVFDSSVFVRSLKNEWLTELARRFSLSRVDSTALFDDGWIGYLATRYIVSRFPRPEIERRERLDLMINALSFFPTNPLAAGRVFQPGERENLSLKGRYFFLMLEYLLGEESFTAVIKKMYGTSSSSDITIQAFQTMCEEAYGSPLDWFFREWLYRSSAPEFTLQWRFERTQRGIVLTSVVIEQRGDVFTMPVTIAFTVGSKRIPRRILVENMRQEFRFTFAAPPTFVDIDPDLSVLRWLLDIRILAHARSSLLFRIYNKDVSSAEREAHITLDLDPVNATGSAPIAYFSLGKLAVLKNSLEHAKGFFLKAMQSQASEESSLYPLLSLIRYGNVLEMEGKRSEAIPLYQRAASEGKRNTSLFAPVIIEAEKYLNEQFTSTEEFWYGIY